jgi:hypothetical protein
MLSKQNSVNDSETRRILLGNGKQNTFPQQRIDMTVEKLLENQQTTLEHCPCQGLHGETRCKQRWLCWRSQQQFTRLSDMIMERSKWVSEAVKEEVLVSQGTRAG